MVAEVNLAELLIARMSHDISGPIGAVHNGMEFIADDNFDEQNGALELLSSSANEAVARLQYYRYAYGIVSYGNQADIEIINKLITSLYGFGKVTVNWQDYNNQIIIKSEIAKILLNLLSITSNMLIRGGVVDCSVNDGEILIQANGKTIKEHESIDLLINNDSSISLDTSNIHLHYLYKIIKKSEMELEYNLKDDVVQFICK